MQNFFRRLSTPGALPPAIVFGASIATMTLVFAIDPMTPRDVRLYLLYSFPLAAIALHCERKSVIVAALVLSMIFQFATFFLDAVPDQPLAIDAVIATASALPTIALTCAPAGSTLAFREDRR